MTKEFKIKKLKDATVYTLESASAGGTSAGAIASVSSPMGGVRKRGDNLITQEGDKDKVDAGKPRNFVAKNAKMGGAGAHKDKKKAAKQGDVKHKNKQLDVAEDLPPAGYGDYSKGATNPDGTASAQRQADREFDRREYERKEKERKEKERKNNSLAEDHEVSMASNELKSIHANARKLLALVQHYGEQGDLEAWQQSKITKAADYLNSVLQSIGGEHNALGEVSLGDYRKKAGMQKALAGMGAMFAPDPEQRAKELATFKKRERGLDRVKARDERDRKSEQDRQLADLVARLPELKAEYEEMRAKYKALGGSDWQYADREQNLSDREREARSMEGPMNNLWRQIQAAEKAQNQDMGEGFLDFFKGTRKTKPGQLELYKAYDTFTIYYDRGPEVFVVVGAGEYKDKFKPRGFDDSYNAEFYGEQMTDQKRDKKPIKVNTALDLTEKDFDEAAPFAVRMAGGAALGALSGTGGGILGATLGPVFGPLFAGYAGYSGFKLGAQAADDIWDWAAKKLGGDGEAAEFAKAHMRAAAKGEDTFEFNGSTFKTSMNPTEVPMAAKAVKQVSEGKRLQNDLLESWNQKKNEVKVDEDWQKVNKKDKTDGMSRKAVKAYRRENPGSKLKTAVTTKPSKLKKGSKSAKRRKSFCARMSGMKKAHASAKTKRDPDSPINKALRRWNCEEDAYMNSLNAQVLEKLNPQAPVDVWVQDFQKADPNKYHQFKNKTPQKKAQMAVAARYAANEPNKKK